MFRISVSAGPICILWLNSTLALRVPSVVLHRNLISQILFKILSMVVL